MSTDYNDEDVVGAIRLALEASHSEKTAAALIEALVGRAPDTPPTNTGATALLVETIKNMGALIRVTDA